jgi:hypothetical protein
VERKGKGKRVNVGVAIRAEKGKNSQSVLWRVNAKYDLGRGRSYVRRLIVAKNNVIVEVFLVC